MQNNPQEEALKREFQNQYVLSQKALIDELTTKLCEARAQASLNGQQLQLAVERIQELEAQANATTDDENGVQGLLPT